MNPAENYILSAKEPYRTILIQLQILIENQLPSLLLKFKWGLPFYYVSEKQPFCYLNQSHNYVDLVFYHGTHLELHNDKLISKGRKHMKSLRYFTIEDIDEMIIFDLLKEAYSVKERKYYK